MKPKTIKAWAIVDKISGKIDEKYVPFIGTKYSIFKSKICAKRKCWQDEKIVKVEIKIIK